MGQKLDHFKSLWWRREALHISKYSAVHRE